MDRHLEPRRERQQALDPARDRAAVPVVQQAARVEDERIVGIRQLGGFHRLDRRHELPLPARERLGVEEARPGMIGRRAGPLQPAFTVEARVGDSSEERRQPRHLVEDVGGVRVVELAVHAHAQSARHPLGQLAGDPPVGPRLAPGLQRLAHALNAPLGVGERPFLLGEGSGGQEHVSALGRLVHEEVLHHEPVELADGLLGMMQIGLGEQRILADHVHRPHVAAETRLDHVGHDEARRVGRPHAPRALELRQRLRAIALVAGKVGRDTARVTAPLDVVLPAQRGDSRAGKSELAGDEREVQQRVRVVNAVDVLGDAHPPHQAGAGERGPGVPARGLGDVPFRHAGDALGLLERERLERLPPGLEPFGARADEVQIGQALVEDHLRHRVEEGHVRARSLGDPEIGLVDQLDALGVDDDDARTVVHRAPEANRDDGMIRGGVGAHDHDAAGLLVVDVRVRRGARAHRDEHRLHRRGVTEARAVVDVVRAHYGAHELLHDIAVLVGRLGAGQRTEPAMMAREPIGGEVERLVPRGLAPAAVDLHERRRDAIARVDEPGPEAALHAQRAQARAVGGSVVGHDRESTIGADVHADPAAHATIGARGLDAPVDRRRRLLRPERARRTRRHALAARRADRRRHGAIAEHADLHRVAAPEHRDRADLLDVVAGDRAAAAEDARLAVQDEERLGVVGLELVE